MSIYNWQPGMTLEAIEKDAILKAYRHYRGNKTVTAQALGIAIRTLDNKLESYAAESKLQQEAADDIRQKTRDFELRARGKQPATVYPRAEETGPTFPSRPPEGLRVEPPHAIPQKQAVSMSVGEKVQNVSPEQNSPSRAKRGRG